MPRIALLSRLGLAGGLLCLSGPACAYESGSTGADGAFHPLVNTELALPPSGVFNFSSVDIPSGVTVTFKKNATNTPVVLLVAGNVTVAGTLNLSGDHAASSGAAGDGNIGDDGLPGQGGPGGYDGGAGGSVPRGAGGAGLGPGGGTGGVYWPSNNYYDGGGGAGFAGEGGWQSNSANSGSGKPGKAYGSHLLLPLIGGSGGGGGAGGTNYAGTGGGGGGGALLIAASGTVQITGAIRADGGASGQSSGTGCGGRGGYGSGGALRIVASAIAGNGTLSATNANSGYSTSPGCWVSNYYPNYGGWGSSGRIRLEAETFTRTAASSPAHSFGPPGPAFVAGFPTLRIAHVAGVEAPAQPTGRADLVLPADTPNPVTVGFATTGVPVGNTVKLTLTPQYGTATSVISPALTGSTEAATASVQVTLPEGPSTLSATTTYTVVAAVGDALAPYAQGERVKAVTLVAGPGREEKIILTTGSGQAFETPRAVLARLGGPGDRR